MEDKFLVDLLEARYDESISRFKDGEHTHEDLTIMLLKHQTNQIAHLGTDLRAIIKEQGESSTPKLTVKGNLTASSFKLSTIKLKNRGSPLTSRLTPISVSSSAL